MLGLCNSISGSLTEAVCLFRVRARSPLHGFVMLFLWFGVLETCKSFDVICIPGAPTVEFPCGIDEASKAEANGLARCCAHAERLLESCPQFPAKVTSITSDIMQSVRFSSSRNAKKNVKNVSLPALVVCHLASPKARKTRPAPSASEDVGQDMLQTFRKRTIQHIDDIAMHCH